VVDKLDQAAYYPPPEYYPNTMTGNTSMNRGLEPSVMKYRLDTEPQLMKLELFLRSAKIIEKEMNGEIVQEMVQVARPLCNEEGIQALMGYMNWVFGPHTVQGNFQREGYNKLIYEINIYLAEIIATNMINWDIREEDYHFIIENIMTAAMLFLSRTIDNKEREGYGQSMMTKEMNVVNGPEKKGILSRIFGR